MDPSTAIKSLLAADLTESEIATRVGTHQSVINRIKHGSMQPKYELGKALIDLALEVDDSRRGPAANGGDAASETNEPAAGPLKDAA